MGDNKKLKRFVTYIYEYERGTRGRNVGFIRTDIRDTCCRMEIHIRGLDRFKGKCMVYLVASGDDITGIPVADILLSQGTGLLKLNCPQNRIGSSGYTVSDLQALVIRYGSGKVLAGCFVNEPSEKILRGDFIIWEPASETVSETIETAPEARTQTDAKPVTAALPEVLEKAALEQEAPENSQTKTAAEPDTDATAENGEKTVILKTKLECPCQPGTIADTPAHENSQKLHTLSNPKSVSYQRIEITDIRNLPRRNWHLCNNSFLVHGFFNYHYLIMKTIENDEETQQFIGVPGIYEQPERMMAMLFGFPEFEAAAEDVSGNPHSQNANGTFGYWMCQVGM